jgi:hypothetical protein
LLALEAVHGAIKLIILRKEFLAAASLGLCARQYTSYSRSQYRTTQDAILQDLRHHRPFLRRYEDRLFEAANNVRVKKLDR